jgi:hypothetical protein
VPICLELREGRYDPTPRPSASDDLYAVEPGTEVRTPTGELVARAGDLLDLSDDDQPHGWPLHVIELASGTTVKVIE